MKMGTVVREIPRAAQAVVERLGALGVSTVHEAQGRTGLMRPYMRPIYSSARIAGSAVTVLAHPGDNWMMHVAAELVKPGDVVVVATTAECSDAYLGELIATSFRAHGVLAAVIDGGCRDVSELRQIQFPVWSRHVSAKGTIKATVGCVNTTVVCAGAAVAPGDVIVADDDGVVVVPRLQAAKIAPIAEERAARELKKRERLARGELNLDIELMRDKLTQAGLVYYQSLEEAGQGTS
jgi:4-hydroxy-4-methyl-2-oxoglutarate aldolase